MLWGGITLFITYVCLVILGFYLSLQFFLQRSEICGRLTKLCFRRSTKASVTVVYRMLGYMIFFLHISTLDCFKIPDLHLNSAVNNKHDTYEYSIVNSLTPA